MAPSTLFALLALARMAAAIFCLAMVHPDEFFQSQEVMARLVVRDRGLRSQLLVPWEFAPASPNRSVLFPALVAGLPYQAMRWLGVEPSGFLLLVVPRLLLCSASFVIDAVLYAAAKKLRHPSPMRVVLGFASSWPVLVLLARPFSNSLETLLLALCFAALLLSDPHKRVAGGALHRQTLLLGALLALGVFARFTFIFFFFPLGVELVRRQDALLLERTTKKKDKDKDTAAGGVSMGTRAAAALLVALQGLLAFSAVSAAVVAIDTLYFHPEMRALESWRRLPLTDAGALLRRVVVAPLNNLHYNLRLENLELHGVHARVTHVAVNLPLLFGPLHVLFFGTCLGLWRGSALGGERRWLRAASVLFPLACLSAAPHQEPRFLLPLVVPLHLFAGPSLLSTRLRVVLWLAFNAALAGFFGVLHQGGVAPLLLAFSRAGRSAAGPLPAWLSLASCEFQAGVPERVGHLPLMFYKTYMPPRFLLAGVVSGPSFRVVDLAGGADASELAAQLEQVRALAAAPSARGQAFLAVPASVSIERIVASPFVKATARVGRCSPHVSTEDLALHQPLALELHLLDMAEERA